MINPNFRDTFIFLETFEKVLNVAGYVPLIGTFTGACRHHYARLEIITGLAFSIFAAALHLKGKNPEMMIACLTFGATLIGHGILNKMRARLELFPFIPLVTTLPYDLYASLYLGKRIFSYL